MGLHSPTPIQAATVPLALLGRDVCACAVTGSGNSIGSLILLHPKEIFIRFRKNHRFFITDSRTITL